MDVEKYAYYVNKRRQNVGLKTWKWRQIVTSQTTHTKCKWPPYDPEPNPPWKCLPGRRFLKQPAEKLKAVFVAFDKERRIPAVGASTENVDIN